LGALCWSSSSSPSLSQACCEHQRLAPSLCRLCTTTHIPPRIPAIDISLGVTGSLDVVCPEAGVADECLHSTLGCAACINLRSRLDARARGTPLKVGSRGTRCVRAQRGIPQGTTTPTPSAVELVGGGMPGRTHDGAALRKPHTCLADIARRSAVDTLAPTALSVGAVSLSVLQRAAPFPQAARSEALVGERIYGIPRPRDDDVRVSSGEDR
jgi:hypothetical protein